MKLTSILAFILIVMPYQSFAGTVHTYKNDNGTTILTNKKRDASEWNHIKTTTYEDSPIITRHLSEKEIEAQEIKNYKQQHREWLKKGGKNSGLRPPVKPTKIVHELTFWPILYGQLWVGSGLVAFDAIEIPYGFDTNEDCMANKTAYISAYSKHLNLDIPSYVKVAKKPKKTYTLSCYSSIDPIERYLVP
ncbi:hypothetical protein GPS60_12980 [Acinetobacter haemolyticus]|uniref:hypothetical protein n=1 Tax=Acinetobacter haemolyticus TaxID=29430 RepID=UPI001372E8D8|nr:hypothetical protein [Acinetobacter haemolyticus]NAR48526.1 hypothetical protein [Acinetobacter haemolyticus]